MKQIPATKLRTHFHSILNRLEPQGILIPKRGKPVARLLPVKTTSASLIGCLRGKVRVLGDTFSTGLKWEAESLDDMHD